VQAAGHAALQQGDSMSDEVVDPIAQKIMDAHATVRDLKAAGTEFNRQGIRTRRVWKGNHHRCKHETGVCDAKNGWQVNAERLESGKYPFTRIVIDMNMEKRAQGGQVVEYPESTELDPELYYRAKGFRSEKEIANAADLKASPDVETFLRGKHLDGIEQEMKHYKAPWSEVQKAKAALNEQFDVALGKKPTKPSKAA
jgi:hypothetical protein